MCNLGDQQKIIFHFVFEKCLRSHCFLWDTCDWEVNDDCPDVSSDSDFVSYFSWESRFAEIFSFCRITINTAAAAAAADAASIGRVRCARKHVKSTILFHFLTSSIPLVPFVRHTEREAWHYSQPPMISHIWSCCSCGLNEHLLSSKAFALIESSTKRLLSAIFR